MIAWKIVRGAVLAVALAIAAGGAAAQSLDQLRAQGVVGERFDGYAVVRQSSQAAERIVAAVNAKRRAIYTRRAEREHVPVAQVGRVYAVQIMTHAPKGTWFLSEDGHWTRR